MAQAAQLIPVDEYLHTTYHPDCEYLDGQVIERNLGEREHSTIQAALMAYLWNRRRELKIHVFPEQRVQIAAKRYLVPDSCVTIGQKPREPIVTSPPFLCIEVMSPEDRMSRVERRIELFLEFGVKFIWLVDPEERHGWVYTRESRVASGETLWTRSPDIDVPLMEIFSELD